MRWAASTIASIDSAAAAARVGTPTVVAIEGRSGFGKSTLLRAALSRLEGFQTLRAYGEETAQDDRFQLLTEWLPTASPRHALQATRLLTQIVGDRQLTGPVALVVDDLQWVDADSVDALAAVVERSGGDRLLVVAAHRPLGARHPRWRRLGPPTVHLDGLDPEAAKALVTSLQPDAPPDLAEALRVHTGGSPLHMRALLQEHPADELAALSARGELPAPADLAAAVDARVAQLDAEAARLLHALAVLGDTWTDVATAGAVAGVGAVGDVEDAVAVLAAEGLVRVDRTPVVPRVRLVHAVLRAAAYDTIPAPTRRRLHRMAAARLTDTGDRLRHRLAAAPAPDDGLAHDLDRHADDLHGRARYREAARFRRLAAGTSATLAARDRRLLDADIESIVAREPEEVSFTELDEDAGALRRFVHALRLSSVRRWVDADRVLDDLDPEELDPLNAYRARVLRGWTILGAGRPADLALPPLEEAARATVRDGTFHRLFVMSYGHARQATTPRDDPVWGLHDVLDVDRTELASSPEGLALLSWRGAVRAVNGSCDAAIDDLTVITQRIADGVLDSDDGVSQALLGFAQWCRGEWRRAAITLGLARAAGGALPPHPLVLAAAPLAAVATGEDPRENLARSRDARLAGPAPVAMYVGDVTEIVALAFCGTPRERREWRARRVAHFGAVDPEQLGRVPTVWLLAMGLGASWAEDPDATDRWAEEISLRTGPAWRTDAAAWLRARAARLRGTPARLDVLARRGLEGLASFAALLRVDAAHTAGPGSRDQARSALTRLEADRYAATLLPRTPVPHDPLAALSDREREVATLLLEGLSYAQIAGELFVTRSTVAFHLSNIYAKTATASRHEFVQRHRRVVP